MGDANERGRSEPAGIREPVAARGWHRAWEVVLVGSARDLRAAYTAGMADLGLPELYLPARPTHGDDRGAGWRLSRADLASLVDDFAVLSLSGELRLGRSVVEAMDGGFSTVTFTPAAARVAAGLGTALPPRQPVVPVHWRLRRPPPHRHGTDPAGRGVPLPAAVTARARQVRAADAALAGRFMRCLDLARRSGQGPSGVRPVLAAVARMSGCEGALTTAEREAGLLAAALTGRVDRSRGAPAARHGTRPAVREQRHARALLLDGLLALVGAEALADRLPPDVLARARGPWEWAVHTGRLPGPSWRAPAWAMSAVAELLSTFPPDRLAAAGRRLGRAAADPEWSTAHERLMGLVTTGAAAADDAFPVLNGHRLAGLSAAEVEQATGVEVLLVPATARGDVLGLDAWRVLTAPLGEVLDPLPHRPPQLARR